MFEITRLRLPLQASAVPDTVSGGWISVIAGLRSHEVVDLLKDRWSSLDTPYLQKLSAAILGRELRCLSVDSHGNQWLSFADESSPLHVAPPSALPEPLRARFPFHQIPGLADFVENFGGLANWSLPPCPWFVPAPQCRVVASDCDYYDWGLMGDWAGSLTLYNTGTGNFMVVSPKDECAKWDHDIGWERHDENPFERLNWTMSTLIEEFIAFLALGEDEARDSPFYDWADAQRVPRLGDRRIADGGVQAGWKAASAKVGAASRAALTKVTTPPWPEIFQPARDQVANRLTMVSASSPPRLGGPTSCGLRIEGGDPAA